MPERDGRELRTLHRDLAVMATNYAAGLEHHAEELETAARLSRLRAKRLGGAYSGDALTVFSEAMAAAARELRMAARQLQVKEPPDAD